MKAFADLADLPEDDRIRIIGETAVQTGQRIGFVVDDAVKADRYIEKLLRLFPALTVLSYGAGPVKDTVMVAVRKKEITQ